MPNEPQTRSKQKMIIAGAAKMGELGKLCWYAVSWGGGKESTIRLESGAIPVVPMALCPGDNGELSRLVAEIMCAQMRHALGTHREIQPAIIGYQDLEEQGFAWVEWELPTYDYVCPHCGEIRVKIKHD